MAADFIGTQIGSAGLITFFSSLVNLVINLAIIGVVAVLMWFVFRFLSFSSDVEFWEVKNNEIVYYGDDKAKRTVKKGVSFISFLKNRTPIFKGLQYPTSEYVYRKRFFGSKLKYIINGDTLIPSKLKVGNPHDLALDVMPSFQKIDYLQRMDAYDDQYKNQKSNAQLMTLVVGFALIGIILFGLFIIWQSNVATAEATQALASAINADAASRAVTFPVAAG